MTFQEMIQALESFWSGEGCAIVQPYDREMGAGTFHPATFFGALEPGETRVAYVQPCRRPTDGRYGENPNRLQRYYQFQVMVKPSPTESQSLYLRSLAALGIRLGDHDIRFVHDDWESPTLGAWGLGWEVWLDGMEVTQFTYFQQMAGYECRPPAAEITYGLERLTSYLANTEDVWHLEWAPGVTFADLYQRDEWEQGAYTFEWADPGLLGTQFSLFEQEAARLLAGGLVIPGYEQMLKASHAFNHLDARGAISPTERQTYLDRIRRLARSAATEWLRKRHPEVLENA